MADKPHGQREMRTALLLILILLLMPRIFPQTLLRIHHADLLKQDVYGGKIIYGNIDIEYDVYRVKCDSAVVNKDMTHAMLFKNIQFTDTARTIKCRTATLSKTPNGRIAYLSGKVSIKEKDAVITGNEASLNEISDRITVSDSVVVRYYDYPSILFCSNLELDTKNDMITSQDLDSVLCLDSLRFYRLYSKRFIYDTGKKLLNLDTKIDMYAFEYSPARPENQSIEPSNISKTARTLVRIKEGRFSSLGGKFHFDPFRIQAQGKCSFVMSEKDEADSIYFRSDKISYSEEEDFGTAEGKVFLRKGKIKINAGLAKYFGNENTAKFFDKPIVTYDSHKLSGDSMEVLSKSGSFDPERAVVYGKPRYESVPDSLRPEMINILTGKLMKLWFSDNEINKIIVSKEAEGVYFISREKDKAPDASNYLLGEEIELNFSEGDIKDVSIRGGCEGIYFPDKLKMKALEKKKK